MALALCAMWYCQSQQQASQRSRPASHVWAGRSAQPSLPPASHFQSSLAKSQSPLAACRPAAQPGAGAGPAAPAAAAGCGPGSFHLSFHARLRRPAAHAPAGVHQVSTISFQGKEWYFVTPAKQLHLLRQCAAGAFPCPTSFLVCHDNSSAQRQALLLLCRQSVLDQGGFGEDAQEQVPIDPRRRRTAAAGPQVRSSVWCAMLLPRTEAVAMVHHMRLMRITVQSPPFLLRIMLAPGIVQVPLSDSSAAPDVLQAAEPARQDPGASMPLHFAPVPVDQQPHRPVPQDAR